MGKFLFIVPPLTGHVNPTLGLGAELLTHGHNVAWLSFDPALQPRIPQGGTFLLLNPEMDEAQKEKISSQLNDMSKKAVYGLDSLKFLYEDVLIPINTGMFDEMLKLINTYKPDVIINDHQLFSGAVAAIKKNIPYATSVTAPAAIKVNASLPMIHEWEGRQVIEFQKKMGVLGEERLDCSRLLTIVYTSEKLFGKNDLPGYNKFIGPSINRKDQDFDFDWVRLSESKYPKILVSIGTTFDHSQKKAFFDKVIDAFANEEITVVVISDPSLFEIIPDNFMVYKTIPQLKVIPHMDAVVCHGGHNTVCETLSYAKPLVVIPIAYDQSYEAGCVVDSGSGIRLNFNRFKSIQLRESVNTILADPSYAQNANLVKQSFDQAGGVEKGVSLLEELLKNI
ncbi:MAG: hypothetical protein RL662_1939 [Bacteroidota bacterium]|jgi:MGT family glycosyltransferase